MDNMRKTGFNGVVQVFPGDFTAIGNNDIFDVHRYLMKEAWYKIMFQFIMKILVGLLSICAIGSFGSSLASSYKTLENVYISKQPNMSN